MRPVDVLRVAHDELGEAQAELRDLARGLHPVALSERGLRSALESLAAGCELPVTLDVTRGRAAGASRARHILHRQRVADERAQVRRRERGPGPRRPEGDALLVEIADDGCGGADAAAGTGLRGLADRIDALGGRLEVDSPPGGGTRVSARLPLTAGG